MTPEQLREIAEQYVSQWHLVNGRHCRLSMVRHGDATADFQDDKLALVTAALEEVARRTRQECRDTAAGWTGDINTVENASVVTAVCRGIAAAIQEGM